MVNIAVNDAKEILLIFLCVIIYYIYIRKFFLRNGEVKYLDFASAKTIKKEKKKKYL